jgi:hypothetical protein
MAFQISPGVNYSEVDLTTVVPSVLTTAGAFAGTFTWGPAQKRIQITNEIDLVAKFGNPNSNSATSFFTAASFLAYGNNLTVARAVGVNSRNARANTSSAALQINNEDVFQAAYLTGTAGSAAGPVFARYPGALGNSLVVGLIDSGGNFATWNVNTIGVSSYFNGAPGTSAQAAAVSGTNDEMHIIVLDADGLFTGVKNQVLEVFPYVSKGVDATDALGNSNYYKNVIYNNSKYIYFVDPQTTDPLYATFGSPLANTNFASTNSIDWLLVGGTDDNPSTANSPSRVVPPCLSFFISSFPLYVQSTLSNHVPGLFLSFLCALISI